MNKMVKDTVLGAVALINIGARITLSDKSSLVAIGFMGLTGYLANKNADGVLTGVTMGAAAITAKHTVDAYRLTLMVLEDEELEGE